VTAPLPFRPPPPPRRRRTTVAVRCHCGRLLATFDRPPTTDTVQVPRCPSCDRPPPWRVLRRRLAAGERAYVITATYIDSEAIVQAMRDRVRDLRITSTGHRWAAVDRS
jgi:hypothetical protein